MALRNKAQEAPKNAFDEAVFVWMAPEYLHTPRGFLWYSIAGILDLALVFYAYFTHTWTMALVFLTLPVIYALQHRNENKAVEVRISSYGIQFGDLRVPYTNIKSFWILHQPPQLDELHLLTNNKIHPEMTIHLMGVNPSLLRQYLVTQIHESEGKKPALLDLLVRFLRLG
jgi:hypothetical protein